MPDPRELRTSLGSGREETNLDFLLPKLISEPSDSFPSAAADRVPVCLQVINKMDFSSGVNSNLVARANAQTWAIVGTKIHETFAGRRISLFIDGPGDGKLGGDTLWHREKVCIGNVAEDGLVDIDGRGLGSGWNVGASRGRDAVLNVGPCNGVGMVRLDVEDDRDNIELKPEPSTKVGCLVDR